jgi:hypothetical protein
MQSPDLLAHIERWHKTHLGYAQAAKEDGNIALFNFHIALVGNISSTLQRLRAVGISYGGAVSPPKQQEGVNT